MRCLTLAIYGNFERNLRGFEIFGAEGNWGRFRGWRSMDDFKQNRWGVLEGRARAGWRSMARIKARIRGCN